MQLYVNRKRPFQEYNQQQFRQIMSENPDLTFFHPDWENAPWHVQCRIDHGDGTPIIINFWPHTAKAQEEFHKSVEGWDEIRDLIKDALQEDDDFDVLEC